MTSPTTTVAPPGWYPDPTDLTSGLRFWNGTAWTARTAQLPDEQPARGLDEQPVCRPEEPAASPQPKLRLTEIQKLLILAVVFSAAGTLQQGSESVWPVALLFSGLGLADTFLRTRRKPKAHTTPNKTSWVTTLLLATLFVGGLLALTVLDTALFPDTDPEPATYDNITSCIGADCTGYP